MAASTSIAISATDNFSNVLVSMRAANQAFRKDVEGTKEKLDALNSTKVEMRIDSRNATDNIREAEKELRRAREGTDDYAKALARLEEAYSDQNNIAANLKLVSEAAREAEKDLKSLSETNEKMENRAGGDGGSILSALAGAGAVKMLGNALSGAVSTFIGSAYGREAGTYFDAALSSASMGAAIGTAIAPGVGTAIGAALGGLVGLFQGSVKVFEMQNEAFMGYYQDQYSQVMAERSASLASGTATAGSRERDLVAFTTLMDGDAQSAKEFQETLIEIGRASQMSYGELSDMARGMLALGHSTETVERRLSSLTEAASALNMTGSEASGIVGMMDAAIEMGRFDSRLIRTLAKKGINVNEALTEAFKEQFSGDMLTEENIESFLAGLGSNGATVEEVVDALYRYMGMAFEGSTERAADTYSGLAMILGSYQEDIDAAMGQGFTDTRSQGMRDQLEWMAGEGGDLIMEANYLIGQWEANLENEKERLQREVMDAVMTGNISVALQESEVAEELADMYARFVKISESDAPDAGAQMGQLLAEAQGIAMNEYNASEGAQLQLNTQIATVNKMRENAELNDLYYDAGYRWAEAVSKGMTEGMSGVGAAIASIVSSELATYPGMPVYQYPGAPDLPPSAWGKDRVPYDNYPALLHEGERVLTANEARRQDMGIGGGIVISGNEFHVREEADIGKIAVQLFAQIEQAQMLMG
ncbi:MAG: hypothetical protein FWG88_05030 [Oscillospiraceae bacterium]|nr:hypothetical protein [Oscillospiraceae bacterium]